MLVKKLRNFSFCFRRVQHVSTNKFLKCDPQNHERPSVQAMDAEYRRFWEMKKKEKGYEDFKLTNIDINTFRQYKHKNNPNFSTEFKVFVTGILLTSWIFFAIYITIQILTPDDFEWVQNERKRLEEAKNKIMNIKEKEKKKELLEKQNIKNLS